MCGDWGSSTGWNFASAGSTDANNAYGTTATETTSHYAPFIA